MPYPVIFEESEAKFFLKYGTHEESDIEEVLNSILAFKKVLHKSIYIASGENIDLRVFTPDFFLILENHEKGSDNFELLLRLVPESQRQTFMKGTAVCISAIALLTIANLTMDLFLKIQEAFRQADGVDKLQKVEKILEEHSEKLNQFSQEQNKIQNPTNPLMILDCLEDDYNSFINPLVQKSVSYINFETSSGIKVSFDSKNEKIVDLSEIRKEIRGPHTVEFMLRRVDTETTKNWSVIIDGQHSAKAVIRDQKFLRFLKATSLNPFHINFKAEVLEYLKREKGETAFYLDKVEILKVDNPFKQNDDPS